MTTGFEFAVLGPLVVTRGDKPIDLGTAGKPRLLLAILLAHRGTPISQEALMVGLWPDHMPVSARKNLHQYIHRLRIALGSERLRALPGGYAIATGAGELDSARFDALYAAQEWKRALDLWRGNAFAEFADAELIAPEAARLQRIRLTAAAQWADASITQGQPQEVLPDLSALVRTNPYDETLAALLMRALAGVGRQAEALEVFQETRARLLDDLGIDPGAVLQEAQRLVLRGHWAPAVVAGACRVPRQLPPDATRFVGRIAELAAIRDKGLPVSVVSGTAGAGKSTFAIHAAHAMAKDFPDGQLYLDLMGSTPGADRVEPANGLGRWLRALGVEPERVPTSEAEAGALFRELTADLAILMVLDNARDAHQVRPLLPAGPACHTIVTSRNVLSTLDNARNVRIDVLSSAEAIELLAGFAPQVREAGDHLAEIVRLCGGLPLALRIVAAKLASRPDWTPAMLAQRLAQERLDELQEDDLGVRASIAISHRELGDHPAASLLDRLGFLTGTDFTVPVAAALLDLPTREAGLALDRLVTEQLVQPMRPGRYQMHDLIRLFASERAAGLAELRDSALSRVLDHYRAATDKAARLLMPGHFRLPKASHAAPEPATAQAALAWIDSEVANIVALVKQAPMGRPATELITTTNLVLFNVLRRFPEMHALGERALEIAQHLDDRRAEGRARENIALALCALGSPDLAADQADAAIVLYGHDAHPHDVHGAILAITYAYAHLERHDILAEKLERAIPVCRDGGYALATAAALSGLGRAYQHLDRLEESMICHKESLAIAVELDDRLLIAAATENIGWTVLRSGDTVGAMRQFRESHRMALDLPHLPLLRVSTLWGIASASYASGDATAARTAWRDALAALEPLHFLRPGEESCLDTDGVPHPPWIIRTMI